MTIYINGLFLIQNWQKNWISKKIVKFKKNFALFSKMSTDFHKFFEDIFFAVLQVIFALNLVGKFSNEKWKTNLTFLKYFFFF